MCVCVFFGAKTNCISAAIRNSHEIPNCYILTTIYKTIVKHKKKNYEKREYAKPVIEKNTILFFCCNSKTNNLHRIFSTWNC